MARRKKNEDHDNHERWLVSYADFITLLFAFFVVMYALSTVNEGKYRVLSDSMTMAFRNIEINTSTPVPIMVTPPIPRVQRPSPAVNQAAIQAAKQAEIEKQQRRDKMRNVAKELLDVMAPLIEQGKVRVIETSRGVTIEINDSILFAPGQAVLNPVSSRAMLAIGQVLAPTDFPITIEGHTDNIPINTAQFPSNWELSAIRATTVLRLFLEAGISGERLTAIGYADTHPVEPNILAEGRARNRRVSILIDSNEAEKGREVEMESEPKLME
ncbi:flagellar motor protein MotD [Betaproteobacteria bacterium]|nr:flagellar motor protein MotD [Betaproteobacteria bacterium]